MPSTITMRRLPALAMLVAGASLLIAADAPTGGPPGTYAFVLSNFYMANGGERDVCPIAADSDLDRYFLTLSPEERAKFSTPDKRQALEKKMNEHFGFRRLSIRGTIAAAAILPAGFTPKSPITPELALEIGKLNGFPAGRGRLAFQNTTVAYSACSNPRDFAALGKGFREYGGPVAAGANLDGKTGSEDFVGIDGSAGIDNQLWRAVGCVKGFRESSAEAPRETFSSAGAPTLIQLSGVDDLRNDPDVEVAVYAGVDQVTRDARGRALARATFAIDPDPALQTVTRGKIVDGILEAGPFDLVLSYKEQIIDAPRHIRGAHLRAALKGEAEIEGSLSGYYTLDSFYALIEQTTQNGANLTGMSCPGVYQAIHRLADGYRDPKTGRFNAISSAHNFVGVRAFIAPPADTGAVR